MLATKFHTHTEQRAIFILLLLLLLLLVVVVVVVVVVVLVVVVFLKSCPSASCATAVNSVCSDSDVFSRITDKVKFDVTFRFI